MLKIVSIEPQRTHMSFDGLGNVLGALGLELIVGEVERRQRPDGKTNIRGRTGDGLCVLALTCTWK